LCTPSGRSVSVGDVRLARCFHAESTHRQQDEAGAERGTAALGVSPLARGGSGRGRAERGALAVRAVPDCMLTSLHDSRLSRASARACTATPSRTPRAWRCASSASG
jgi:hypothetical protein